MSESDWANGGSPRADGHYYRVTFLGVERRDYDRDVGIVVEDAVGAPMGLAMTKQELARMVEALKDAKLL